jgi:hypothetical protein
MAALKRYLPRWTIASTPAAGRSAEGMRASVLYWVGSSPEISTTATSRERKSITYTRVSVELMTRPRGFCPPMTSAGSGWTISSGSFSSIRMMLPGSIAFCGGLMVGTPWASSVTRRSRLVAASAMKPSAAERLKATMNGLVLNSRVPTGSKLTPTFILSVGKASSSCTVSIVDKQLWTFTLKRKGPFGEEQVLEMYAMEPRMTIDSSRLGNAPDTLSNIIVSGSRARVFPSALNAAPTSTRGFRTTVSIT